MILFGREYWQGLLRWLKAAPLKRGFMVAEDLGLVTVTDVVEEAIELILDYQRRIHPPEPHAKALA